MVLCTWGVSPQWRLLALAVNLCVTENRRKLGFVHLVHLWSLSTPYILSPNGEIHVRARV